MTRERFNREIALNEKQWQRFEEWVKEVTPKNFNSYDEDCCGTSPFTWSFTLSGLGATIKVVGFGKTLSLTLDDDGEFY